MSITSVTYYYRAAQIWGETSSTSLLASTFTTAGLANTAISNELSTNSKYAHRINGKARTPQVLNRAKNIKYNSAIKATGALGKVLPAISLALSFKDGYINGWQPHHFADMGHTAAFAIGSCFCPVIALVGVAYAATDLTISLATDKSITERLDY